MRTAAIRSVNLQGALTNTGNTLHLLINGRGWFQVTNANGDTVYTRDGAFNTNQNGQLVTMDGYTVTSSILVPATATNLAISQTGIVTVTLPGQATPTAARPIDDRQFRQRRRACRRSAAIISNRPKPPASRPSAFPATRPSASSEQGYIEASNVDPVTEITNLIAAQRAYEMNSKVIQASDQMSGTISNMRS